MNVLKRGLKAGFAILIVLAAAIGWGSPAIAAPFPSILSSLPSGNAITDGRALLRYALPIANPTVRQLQQSLEDISTPLRIGRKRIGSINGYLTQADRIVTSRSNDLLKSIPDDRQTAAADLIAQIKSGIGEMRLDVEAGDRDAIWIKRGEVLNYVGSLESLMVGEFPYTVPPEYSNLPQLKGRSTIAVTTNKGDMTLVVDGFSAPVTAGNFVDLVDRGFYDGLEFTRAEDSYVLQIGDPPGKEVGFIDPDTGKYRAVPFEVLAQGDKEPTYGITLEDAGRYLDQPVLPFSAFGTLAMARPAEDVNGGSSQFFFFLFEAELTPAGRNLLDGRYAVFGYLTQGKEVLEQLKEGDKIISAKVVSGAENLVKPPAS